MHEAKIKFFIVDDSATIRFALKAILEKEGYVVVGQHGTGVGLLQLIERLRPDVICLDYHLPDSNGLDLLKAIHTDHPAVSVIFITGSVIPTLESDAAEAGAAGFVHKPFTQDRVVAEFHQVVHAHRLLAQAFASNTPTAVGRTRATAIVADDSATMRMLLVSILKENDIGVLGEASNGRQAVEMTTQHNPDIVCLDIEMPVLSGLDALREIRTERPAVKVLMITGSQRREYISDAGGLGAAGYILKPYRREKVGEALRRIVDSLA